MDSRIDVLVDRLQEASESVSSYFTKVGGDPMNDNGFDQYCDVATNLTGEIEILRESYHDILKTKGLIQPAAPLVGQSDLINALKTPNVLASMVQLPCSKLLLLLIKLNRCYYIIRFLLWNYPFSNLMIVKMIPWLGQISGTSSKISLGTVWTISLGLVFWFQLSAETL